MVSTPGPEALLKLGSELVNAAVTPVVYVPGPSWSSGALTAANVPIAVPMLGAVTVPGAPATPNVTVPVAPIVGEAHEPRPTYAWTLAGSLYCVLDASTQTTGVA